MAINEPKNIGLALSGGGIRAMVFHLGLFKWLAEMNLLEQVRKISSVSGASLCVGMIYAHNNLAWPSSQVFLTKTLPSIEETLKVNLQMYAIARWLFSPRHWNKRVNIIAKVLENRWGVHGNLQQLTGDVIWIVNCTTYETGKRFHFCQNDMGDHVTGYVNKPNFLISEAMAASAGFPLLIGPYALRTDDFTWTPSIYAKEDWQPPGKQTIHLWDGGVYDNLGLESIYKLQDNGTLDEDLEFLIVSNASSPLTQQDRPRIRLHKNLSRILDISMSQVAAVRTRSVMDFIIRTQKGMYLKIGNTADYIASQGNKDSKAIQSQLTEHCLSAEQVNKAMNHKTTLWKPSASEYQLLLRHGYEVANCTYQRYFGEQSTEQI